MIFGIGTDLVELKRIELIYKRYGDKFVGKLLSPHEFERFDACTSKATFLAKTFAAKEAFVKALGTGLRGGITLPQITIARTNNGKPTLHCEGKAKEALLHNHIKYCHITLSDEKHHAIAFVVLEL